MAEKKRLSKAEIAVRKELAKNLFTKDGVTTQKELAERVGISEKSIGKWIAEEKWETQRAGILMTREVELKRLYKQFTNLNDAIEKRGKGADFPDSKEADILKKLTASIRDLETEVSLQEACEVLMKLINFARTENLTEAKIIMKWADLMIKTLVK
ncbi:DDE transposase family protein [Mucilaginibacter rubeus]|uniref:DDE transposase family protein n=1 Tax=Mucilaginibacter rubeus TaxID=2027860 RepID=A0A5C1I5H5_9SPHI|nr:DDE transposase family protein [Mucilaginibacter rubeus]QEM13472.1 DDE transposase family protein [Mucilaginibacter rubeus]